MADDHQHRDAEPDEHSEDHGSEPVAFGPLPNSTHLWKVTPGGNLHPLQDRASAVAWPGNHGRYRPVG